MGNRCQQCANSNAVNEKRPEHPIVPPLDRNVISPRQPVKENVCLEPEATTDILLVQSSANESTEATEATEEESDKIVEPESTKDNSPFETSDTEEESYKIVEPETTKDNPPFETSDTEEESDKIVKPESTKDNSPSETSALPQDGEKFAPRVSVRVLQAINRLKKPRISVSGELLSSSFDEGTITASPRVPPLMVPPMETVCEGSMWNITGIYEHQALKVGLRRLDQAWDDTDLYQFPSGRGSLLTERLFRNLLTGEIQFQSVHGTEIAAAQSDIQRLSLVQLLRLRVLLLDFVPSLSGHNCNGAGEAFIRSLDGSLFQKLGEQIACGGIVKVEASNFPSLGREAILMVAAAGAVTSPRWWAWWVPGSDRQRVFFDAQEFAIVDTFPGVAVLETLMYSKPDANDATGQFWWMDWQIKLIQKEDDLNPDPPRPRKCGVANLVCRESLRSGRARLKSNNNPQ